MHHSSTITESKLTREKQIQRLILGCFNAQKYLNDPPHLSPLLPTSYVAYNQSTAKIDTRTIKIFLVYIDFGLVGTFEATIDGLIITNLSPRVWGDYPEGRTLLRHGDVENQFRFPFFESLDLERDCRRMGFEVDEDDVLTIAAITLEPLNEKLQVLASDQVDLKPLYMSPASSKQERNSIDHNVKPRLLVLDVDNTLLSTHAFDAEVALASGSKLTAEGYLELLPSGGVIPFDELPAKTYPRPHLKLFITAVQAMGYDLAICTTATREYIDRMLPLCGIDLTEFSVIKTREDLTFRGSRIIKDIRMYAEYGYDIDQIVVIDDRRDVYYNSENLLLIKEFLAYSEAYKDDQELLIMLKKLEYLGYRSLPELRKEIGAYEYRERQLEKLLRRCFKADKHVAGYERYHPTLIRQRSFDLDFYYHDNEANNLVDEMTTFFVYIDYGLVGLIKIHENGYLVDNLCPNIWKNIPGGKSQVNLGELEAKNVLSGLDEGEASKICKDLGYEEYSNDILRAAAISLLPLSGNMHVLAYFSLFDDEF
ncbi:HAD family hydrolase [Gilvimarinus xylanilyticus]|uniref:HAD family hydrolase n=1 Tax=Gilvimarinus xylanilyticus TaxID=2944139 RepID=A0A9X2HZN9_9GAMM|nr:HAD family hydrolase [Gilvimarinus xylanilyticus]MCP8900054.1 HAD family hydrolase [Gilvimarinus xylanilyticus]